MTGACRTTLLRAPRMDARSGVWLEGLTRRDAQSLFVVVPWACVVSCGVINIALYVAHAYYPPITGLKRVLHGVVAVGCILYVPVTLLCERSLCCCIRENPRRSREGWLALAGMAVAAGISMIYAGGAYGWMHDPTSPQTHFIVIHGTMLFRTAATCEFLLQLLWLWAADRLRFDREPTPMYKVWGRFCLLILWLLTYSGPMSPSDGQPRAWDHVLVLTGYSARVALFFWCVAHLCRKCACSALADWRKMDKLPCSPGRGRLRYLAYFVLTRPAFLILMNLPLGYPLEVFAWFASTVRCGLLLLLAVALRPAPRSAMGEHPLEAETRENFDIALAMRLSDYAYETYYGPPPPSILVVKGGTDPRINGEYTLDGWDAAGAAKYAKVLASSSVPASYVLGDAMGSVTDDTHGHDLDDEATRVYLRKTPGGEWEFSPSEEVAKGKRWAYTLDATSAPLLIAGPWFECLEEQPTSNPDLVLKPKDQNKDIVRRFERQGHNASFDARWLLVEAESRFLEDENTSIYIAFRGTSSLQNMLTDARISMRPLVNATTAMSSPLLSPRRETSPGDVAEPEREEEPAPAGEPAPAAAPVASPRPASLMEEQVRIACTREFQLYRRGCGSFTEPLLPQSPDKFPEITSSAGPSTDSGWVSSRYDGDEGELAGTGPAGMGDRPGCCARLCEQLLRCAWRCFCACCCLLPLRICRLVICPFVMPTDLEDDDEDFTPETLERVRIHTGFLNAYESVRNDVMELLQERLAVCSAQGKHVRLYISGHSLGGALASLFALDVSTARSRKAGKGDASSGSGGQIPQPLVYTFGCPRVGNASFRSIYNAFVPGTFRIVAGRDVVPNLPPSVTYRQLGREVWVDDAGVLTYVMSWAMRRILPARDSPSYHPMIQYFRLLGRAYQSQRGYNYRTAFYNDPGLRQVAELQA